MVDLATIITQIIEFAKDITPDLVILSPIVVVMFRLINGIKCLLRDKMLRIYYHNKDKKQIRQYELENFVLLYKAYKALKGNSFIDEIYEKVTSWEVIS